MIRFVESFKQMFKVGRIDFRGIADNKLIAILFRIFEKVHADSAAVRSVFYRIVNQCYEHLLNAVGICVCIVFALGSFKPHAFAALCRRIVHPVRNIVCNFIKFNPSL